MKPSAEIIAKARQDYLDGRHVHDICKDYRLTQFTLYVWLDGGPANAPERLPPLPRRSEGRSKRREVLTGRREAVVSLILYEGPHQLSAHPLLDLIARPNPREDRAGFLESVVANLLIAGNAYIEAVTLEGEEGAKPRELYALRPDRMKVVPGADGCTR